MLSFGFLSALGMTAAGPARSSALNALCAAAPVIPPGVYGNGLVTILDEVISGALLAEWTWLVPRASVAFAITGFGDVFFLDPDKGVHFLEVQIAHIEFIDSDALWTVNEFLSRPAVMEKILREGQIEALVAAHRAILYGEAFVLTPWELLGGDRRACPYDIGKVDVYLNLVGQTLRQVLDPGDRDC